jgi:hypothetical protein
MSNSRRKPILFLLRLVVFVLLFTGVAEVWLRTVTPASESPLSYQDTSSMIVRFDPSGPREGLYTVGRLARRGGNWRVNNAGWLSAVDYQPATKHARPLIALFGDSYIEGFLTDVDQHVDAYLQASLKPACDVYSFGRSGWYLEQYVATSRKVEALYRPDVLVIVIGGADVSDSIRENGVVSPSLWQITETVGAFAEVPPPTIYSQSRTGRLAKLSAIVRYLRYNAKLVLPGMENAAIPEPTAAANDAGDDTAPGPVAAWRKLLPAADYMIERMCAEHPETPIVFVSTPSYSDRYRPVDAVGDTPLFADALAVQAACDGHPQCYFFDLRMAFSRDWAAHKQRFEAADGAHWNAYANRLVAETLAGFIEDNHLLDSP